MEREQIIKDLECCANEWYCGLCEFTKKECALIKKNALALITSQEQRIKELDEENAEVKANWQKLKDSYDNNDKEWREAYADSQSKWEKAYEKLELTLEGVMHSVDKWLDGAELEQDEVKRAITMREKTLQIVEKLTEENERLVTALANYEVRIAEEYYTAEAYEELREENERLHASCTEFERKCASLNDENERLSDENYRLSCDVWLNVKDEVIAETIEQTKKATVKKFAERLTAEFRKDGRMNYYIRMTLDQIKKEMLEGEK